MNNTKVTEIIKFSFYKNIQNKWFILFNTLTLISLIVMLNWGTISNLFKVNKDNEIFTLAILDNSNLVDDAFLNNFETDENFEIKKITENNYNAENIPDDFAVVEIIPDNIEGFKTSIISKEGIRIDIYEPITNLLLDIRNNILSKNYNINSNDLEILQSELSINRIMLGVDAADSDTKELIKLFSTALTYFITILIFSKLANEIAQEKQSKSSEYILTTVSAKEYLFAKIFSNIAILLIQGLLLLAYYFIAVGINNILNIAITDLTLESGILTSTISIDIILYILALLVYNILNLILLCIIQATLSAKTSSTSEAGNTVSLLLFMTMIAYFLTLYIITPYTKVNIFIYILSCLPLLSTYFVPAMMVIGQANLWQVIISLLILIISIPITFKVCAPIFKNGILDYTKRKKIKIKDSTDTLNDFFTKRKMKNIGFVVGIAIILYVGLQMILSLLGNFIMPILLKNLTDTDITLILQAVLQIVSLGISSAFVLAYCNNNEMKHVSHSESKLSNFEKFKIVLIALFFIFVLQILLSVILYPILGLDYNVTDMFNISAESSILSKFILIISIAIVPGIFEELFFRKALINFTLPHGKYFALLFSSLLFGLIHMNLSQGLFAFIIGLILGAIYLYTKDIKLTMLIHSINNGFAAITLILPEALIILSTLVLLAFLFAGFIFLILAFVNPHSRNKIIRLTKINVSLRAIKSKYKYIFTDFTFDVSMVLILIMSILTENILR